MSSKAKTTYRVGRAIRLAPHPARGARWASPQRLEAAKKIQDKDLAEIVVRWGMLFERRRNEADSQSVRKTLVALKSDTDANALAALRLVDEGTLARLRGAAWRSAKRKGEKFSLSDWRRWTADQVREYAADALLVAQLPTGGRPRVGDLHLLFAKDLIRHWERTTGKPATVTKPSALYRASPFLAWATDAFMQAGIVITAQSLAPTLQRAKWARPWVEDIH